MAKVRLVGRLLPSEANWNGLRVDRELNTSVVKNTRLPVLVNLEFDARRVVGKVIELVLRDDGSVDGVVELDEGRLNSTGYSGNERVSPVLMLPLEPGGGSLWSASLTVQGWDGD